MEKIKLHRNIYWMQSDLVICIQNENGHIGSVVVGQPYLKDGQVHVTMNVWNQLGHKDDIVALTYVKAAVKKYQCVVTCICGIHMDDIVPNQIQAILDWVEKDSQLV